MKPYKGHIENWNIKQHGPTTIVVVGVIGENYIRTSGIVNLSMNVVETENSIYSLGKIVWSAS